MSTLVDAIALLHQAWCAVFVNIQRAARRTDALTIDVANESFLDDAQRTLVALHGRIASVTFEAFTNHGTHGQGVQDATFGIYATRLRCVARIDALAMEAGTLRGTIAIADTDRHHTLLLAAMASGHGSWWTCALWTMLIDFAALVAGTDGRRLARIGAFAVHTCLVRGAFVVAAAAKWRATDTRVSAMSRRTLADGTMIQGQALRIWSTLFALASGHAELIAAGMCGRTFRVDATLDLGALELGITLVALATGTHRLVILDTAFGIQSTVAWIAADAIHT